MPKRVPEHGDSPAFVGLFVQLVVLFTALSLFYLAELFSLREPLLVATLWSQGPDRFGDFWHYRALLEKLHRPEFFAASDRFAYPAPCAVLYQWLYHLGPHPHASYDLILWSIEGVSALLFWRALCRSGMAVARASELIALLVVTSYPWHFLYDRGNIEIFVYIFIASGLWAFLRGRETWAAVLWGFAAAFKIYPIILLVLFARRGGWRTLALGLLCCGAVMLGSFWYVGPTIRAAALGTVSGVLGFVGHYGANARSVELVFDHSITGAIKEIFELPVLAKHNLVPMVTRAYDVLLLLLGPWAFLRWRRSMPVLNQACLLLLALVLLPPVSYDYTLIYAYLVLGIVFCCGLQAAHQGLPFPGTRSYMAAFAVICTAQDWLVVHDLRPNGFLKCIALLTVALNVIRYPLRLNGWTEGVAPNDSTLFPAGSSAGFGMTYNTSFAQFHPEPSPN